MLTINQSINMYICVAPNRQKSSEVLAAKQMSFDLFLRMCQSVLCGLRSRSTADSDPQFFLRTRSVRGSDDGKQPRTRIVRGSKLHLAHIKLTLRSSGRMYPAEKQTMQLKARAACASAVHVISAAGVRKSSVI